MAYVNQTYSYAYRYGTEAPKEDPERIRRAKRTYMKNMGDEVEARVKSMRKVKMGISVGQAVLIAVSVFLMFVAAGMYLVTTSGYENQKSNIEAMKKEVQTLKRENDALLAEIERAIDYEAVYEYAIGEGMQTPSNQQVVYYSGRSAEYVSKGMDIPNE